jgi:primosomal replication protein N
MPFKIPAQTPAGKYLLRVDLVYNYWQTEAQLYPTCAHIEVENSVSGDLPKGVKFPEAYEPSMPGEWC